MSQGPGAAGASTAAAQGPGMEQHVIARVHGLDARRAGVYEALQHQLSLCGELLVSLASIAQRALSFAQDELMDRQSKQDGVSDCQLSQAD